MGRVAELEVHNTGVWACLSQAADCLKFRAGGLCVMALEEQNQGGCR